MNLWKIFIKYIIPLIGLIIMVYGIKGLLQKEIIVAGKNKFGREALLPSILAIIFGIILMINLILEVLK